MPDNFRLRRICLWPESPAFHCLRFEPESFQVVPGERFHELLELGVIGDGLPGPVTKQLAEAYRALVIRETGQ